MLTPKCLRWLKWIWWK